MVRLLLLVALALVSTAATAGTRATYVDDQGQRRTILIADNGDIDAELYMGKHLIVRDGRAFIVAELLTGPLVTPLDALEAAATERAAAPRPQISPELEAATRDAVATMEATAAEMQAAAAEITAQDRPDNDPPGSETQPPGPAMAQREGIQVNGRAGRSYYVQRFNQVFAVISDDPALAPIGAALLRAIEAERTLDRVAGNIFPPPGPMDPEEVRILSSGTPIQYYSSALGAVEQVTLPAIALPAEPETGAAVRARLAAEAAARDAPPAPEWDASRAIFAGGRLYLVAGNQRLMSLAEGELALTRHELGEPVLDVCVREGEPIVLTGAVERSPRWTLRRLHDGQWQAERTLARDNDEPLALSCSTEGMFLLTSKRFIDLTQARPVVLRLRGAGARGIVTSVVHVAPQAVFVGLNSGEWGGGLMRIDRRSGRVTRIERNATGALCGGPLNTNCDPVHGLANIPWRPNCLAAAIGLIHFMSHGRLAMVCDDRVEQLYPEVPGASGQRGRAEEDDEDDPGSTAFFGLAAIGNELLTIGDDSLHRVRSDGSATVTPLPRFTRVEGLLVSFVLPDVVLVITGINGRASVSGAVPIMAVRQAP